MMPYGKKYVIDGEGGNVISRITPGTATPVEQYEVNIKSPLTYLFFRLGRLGRLAEESESA